MAVREPRPTVQPSCAFNSAAAEARISRERASSFTARAIDTAPTRVDRAVIAVARSIGSGREEPHQHVDVDADLVGVRGSGARIAAGDVPRQRGDGTARPEVVAVGDAQVRIDDCRQWIVGRLGDGGHRLTAIVERAFDRFGHELVARREVAVEAAMRQPGVAHQVGHADPFDPVLAEAGRGHADDLPVVLALARS